MNIKNIITRLSLDNLLNDLGLEDTSEEFKTKFTTMLEEKYYQLVSLKLQEKLGDKYDQFLETSEEKLDEFLDKNSVDLGKIMQDVADFLRKHLEDYQQGVDDFLQGDSK